MRVLGISGTPRPGGNSEVLLDAALEPFREAGWDIDRILLSASVILPCTGCETCAGGNGCRITGDGMDQVDHAMAACDAVIVASPVYWRNVPAQLKALFDRCYAERTNHPLRGKFGGAIAVGNGTSGGQAIVLTIIYNFFLSSGTLCVPGELNGVSAVAGRPGDIRNQPNRLEQARVLARNIIFCAERKN
ncbi:MAG TPA: flavodoxin family protein [Clostridia bacterium]